MPSIPVGFDFQSSYAAQNQSDMPWFWPELDPDFAGALEMRGLTSGNVVDLGGGTGSQAIALAKMGFLATSTDFSPAALDTGRAWAHAEGVRVNFVLDDVTSTNLVGPFDVILDRGCFHVIAPTQRAAYLSSLVRIAGARTLVFLKTFSADEPPRPGPFRFSERDLRTQFEAHFDFLELRSTVFHGSRAVHPLALFAVLRKTQSDP